MTNRDLREKMIQTYVPQPMILPVNDFPEEISALIDEIARNVHEKWAAGRFGEGWSYGEKRNDHKREHPTLVPYDLLPESEKEYDRETVIATLSYLSYKGYEIKRKANQRSRSEE